MTKEEELDILEQFAIWGYRKGLSHGFTLAKGKPPSPGDEARMDKMAELTKGNFRIIIESEMGSNKERKED